MLKEKGIDAHEHENLIIREYINDMPRCLAAADIVICRCGAMTLAELKAAGRASVLIPSPNVAENHQYHNAMVLANHKAGVVIEEKDLTGELLCKTVKELTDSPKKLKELSENAKALAITDANERIKKEILDLYER
jgi:UDP-N-acetylglucosamine--N-acetylmuramyl-(pentapeptide) pyrophosphoryl-undecaprenol N-acetylglucosamine transferase